jgi:hypothetical protein
VSDTALWAGLSVSISMRQKAVFDEDQPVAVVFHEMASKIKFPSTPRNGQWILEGGRPM